MPRQAQSAPQATGKFRGQVLFGPLPVSFPSIKTQVCPLRDASVPTLLDSVYFCHLSLSIET